MALALTANFAAQQNLAVPLLPPTSSALAVRVASLGSGTLGTLVATGAQFTPVVWSISQNPSWVQLALSADTLTASISFSNAQAQSNAYQFYVTATDGVTTVDYAIFLEVKPTITLVNASGSSLFSVQSYDSTVADIVFEAVGLGGIPLTGVSFIPPSPLPPGMKSIFTSGSSIALRVQEPSATNIPGGITLYQGSPVSNQVTLQAYCPGTLYDTPERAYSQTITIESLAAKQATVDVGLAVQYTLTQNAYEVDGYVDFLAGQPQTFSYQWQVTGTATGTVVSGGTSASSSMIWIPTTSGTVGFTLAILNASGAIIGHTSVAPALCAVNGSWESTNAMKLSLSSPNSRGYAGAAQTLTISTVAAEMQANETYTINLAVSGGSSLEGAATLATSTVTLTSAAPTATVSLTIPVSSINQKWVVTASAANALTGPTRTGFAQMVFLSNGPPPITVATVLGTSLTSNVGQLLTPINLTARDVSGNLISGATFALCGAPDGLTINSSGQLSGNVLTPGTYTFSVAAVAAGDAVGYSPAITLVASPFATPLVITSVSTSVPSLPDNTQYAVSWSYSGTPQTLNMQQGGDVLSVLGSKEITTTQVGNSVITVFGSSFYGIAYSLPVIVVSSSVVALSKLLNSPTIGTIDENYNLTLNWSPLSVDGGYQAYKAWNIWIAQLPNGSPQLQSVYSNLPTGLEPAGATADARIFDTTLTLGDWSVQMQALTSNPAIALNSSPWPNALAFPTALTDTSVSFDNQTIDLGQTLTITLNSAYVGADYWQAIYPDGSTSGWMPISAKVLAKTISMAGAQPIVIQTLRDYSNATPPVKLIRQVTEQVFVMNQQYTGTNGVTLVTGTLGIGGENGFETTNASNGPVRLAPYEVIVRAVVRDVLSNELKLMVATSRTADASSQLGTMAVDVFPIAGRPRDLALINPGLYLSEELALPGNPVSIATTALPSILAGVAMADFPMQATINSGVAPFSWYAEGLPSGLKMSRSGVVSGTTRQLGTYSVNISVMDSNVPAFISHITLSMSVESSLSLSSASNILPNAVVGAPYSAAITCTGGIPPFTWSIVSGTAPTSLSMGSTTGVISGTPVTYNSTTDFEEPYLFTAQVQDAVGGIASGMYQLSLSPAPLQFGPLDQTTVFAGEDFELVLPIFGGKAPYTLTSFVDDVVGTGLRIINADQLALVAGQALPTVTGTTPNMTFFPQSYPFDPSFELTASGGVGPYTFTVVPGAATTLPSATVYGSMMTALATADGAFTVAVQINDTQGASTVQNIKVSVQKKNGGTYTIEPVTIAQNGSTNPTSWTVTPISSLPDAKAGSAYFASSGVFYGLGLYQNSLPNFTQLSSTTSGSINLATGLGANGSVLTAGGQLDANWTVPNLQTSVVGPAQSVYPGDPNYFLGTPWLANDTHSAWICRDYSTPHQGVAPYTFTRTFDLTGFNLATTSIQGWFSGDDTVSLSLNGTQLGLSTDGNWTSWTAFTVGAGSPMLLPGVNALTLVMVSSDNLYEGVRLLGAVTGEPASVMNFNLRSGSLPVGIFTSSANGAAGATQDFSGLVLFNATTGQTPTVLGSSSFEAEFSNIATATGSVAQVVERESITVTSAGGGSTPVVVITTSEPYTIPLPSVIPATGYAWYYPLTAEGGTGPYSFNLQNGTTLPTPTIATINGLPALASTSAQGGIYVANVTATDSNGVISAVTPIAITLTQAVQEPIHIVAHNTPAYVYAGRAIPATTFYVESDLNAAWSITGLPPGVSLTTAQGKYAYLVGTPTVSGTFTATVTATSVSYGSSVSQPITFAVRSQSATISAFPVNATIGVAYRNSTNNAVIQVRYVGYLPTDSNLPLLTSANGTVGAPGVTVNGQVTTVITNSTSDGFTMTFDYVCNVAGNDTITLGSGLTTATIAVIYPALAATGTTAAATISEYTTTATLPPPVKVSGGAPPYTLTPTVFSDSRFTAQNGNVVVYIPSLPVGQTTACQVTVSVSDTAGNTTSAVGTLQVAVQQQSYIQVNFVNTIWEVNISRDLPFTAYQILNQNESIPQLGHSPYQFYVDSVTIPTALVDFVIPSPSNRVLAIQFNDSNTSAAIADVDASLNSVGTFVVRALPRVSAPPVGTYTITALLRVVDADNISASQTVTTTLVVT